MARTSKLTHQQWADIERRLLDGEDCRPIAREYKISESAIRKRLSAQIGKIKEVAKQLVEAEEKFSDLPISAQIGVAHLAAKLRSISTHLSGAAELGAMTAHRLSQLANTEVQKVDEVKPLESMEALKGIGILTELANKSSTIGLNLLNANKETVKKLNEPPDSAESLNQYRSLTDEQLLAIACGGLPPQAETHQN